MEFPNKAIHFFFLIEETIQLYLQCFPAKQLITANSYKPKDNLLDVHYYQSSFIAGFPVASVSTEFIDLYDSNLLNYFTISSDSYLKI